MTRYYYTKKTHGRPAKQYIRYLGLLLSIGGIAMILYFGFPVVTSFMWLKQVYASQTMTTPIPVVKVLTAQRIKNIVNSTINSVERVDSTDAMTWFPSFQINPAAPRVKSYTLSIPTLDIKDATVSTQDYNVGVHLVNYGGTAVPPDKGNAVVFGHSTLPQLFDQTDYKTIFARLHTIEANDEIIATVDGVSHIYKVFAISIVSPTDFAPLMQRYDHSYLTLITCTPPGTTWERLVVEAKKVEK